MAPDLEPRPQPIPWYEAAVRAGMQRAMSEDRAALLDNPESGGTMYDIVESEILAALRDLDPVRDVDTGEPAPPLALSDLPITTRLLLLLADCETGLVLPQIERIPITGPDRLPGPGTCVFRVGDWTLSIRFEALIGGVGPAREVRWMEIISVRTPEGQDRRVDRWPWIAQYRPEPSRDRFTALVEMCFREAYRYVGAPLSRVPTFSVVDPQDERTYRWVDGRYELWKDARGREV